MNQMSPLKKIASCFLSSGGWQVEKRPAGQPRGNVNNRLNKYSYNSKTPI